VTEFRNQDLSGSVFENVLLTNAKFRRVDLSGSEILSARFGNMKMRGVDLFDIDFKGDLQNVVINGVDIAPLVDAELDKRHPGRALMRATTPDEFREAWALLEGLWGESLAHAQTLPEDKLHESVNGEWSFIQTLRHLNFATAAWVGRMIVGDASPWHPLDLPWDEAPGWDGIPWDRDARPSLDEVLAVRRERQATVRSVIDKLDDARLASSVSQTAPGWPVLEHFPLQQCLRIVLKEEWEHRLFAERDLALLESG
jgi:hypothetical protein